jgi:hypothetical protein
MIDIERKFLEVYAHSPWESGETEWFIGVQAFRKVWEFGLTRDGYEDGRDYVLSRYYVFAHRLKGKKQGTRLEFPRKNRWSHVTG